MDPENLNKAKYLLVGGLVVITAAMVAQIFLKHYNQGVATFVKIGGVGIGVLLFAAGIIILTSGDTLMKKLFNKKPTMTSDEEIVMLENTLKAERIRTQLKNEQSIQKAMDNKIDLQKATVESIRADIQKKSGTSGGKFPDVLGNLNSIVRPDQRQNQNYGYAENYQNYNPTKGFDQKRNKKNGAALRGDINIFVK